MRLRVLFVDDYPDTADLLCENVANCDWIEAESVASAQEALAKAERFLPHVAVIDIGMPCMNGWELGERLKSVVPGIRLIALSGYTQPDHHARSLAYGFIDHLDKPPDLPRLISILKSLCP